MKPKDRQREIIKLVDARSEASVDELSLIFDVSAETIRRDLAQLAETGALLKVYGAARRMPLSDEGSFTDRMADHTDAKAEISQKLIAHINPGETVLIDTGSTTLAAAAALAAVPGLTMVTNSLRIAQTVGGQSSAAASVLLLGGRFRADNAQTVGPDTVAQISQFYADSVVLTVTAIHETAGAMDADLDEAQIARAMRNHARRCIVLAHGAKFGKSAPHRVCQLGQVDLLISDARPGPSFMTALAASGVMVC